MKLNNKGLTTIEILLSFVLISVLAFSMYTLVSTYNKKKIVEDEKLKLINYKNILTREIQKDLIEKGIKNCDIKQDIEGAKQIYTVDITLLDDETRTLKVEKQVGKSEYHMGGAEVSDFFMISYGGIEYPLPDLGNYQQDGRTIQNLSINDIIIEQDETVLSIYIGFYHPDLGTRYAIDIVVPINIHF